MTEGLFYAYVKDVRCRIFYVHNAFIYLILQVTNDAYYRYLAVFASRDVADEWWRAVTTAPSALIRNSIRRVTPQFYTHVAAQASVFTTLTDPQGTPQFLDRVFFTLLPDRDGRALDVATPDHRRDRISGQA